jgi:hypothetical protein
MASTVEGVLACNRRITRKEAFVKRVFAALALTALAAAAVAVAQQPTTTQPPASTSSRAQSQSAQPSDRGASNKPDEQTLMRDCLKKMQATNAPAQDIKDYCEKKVKSEMGD